MPKYELKLDPATISAAKKQKDLLEKKKADEYLIIKLIQRLFNENKLNKIKLDLRPSFYKKRPIDRQLQLRHNEYKLLPITNTPKVKTLVPPINTFTLSPVNSTKLLNTILDLNIKYNIAFKQRLIREEIIKKENQNKIANNTLYRLRMYPYPK